MRTDAFDYPLPEELIAQSPAIPRDSCRLLILQRATGLIEHRRFSDILSYLCEGDLLVVNDTKVMPARLFGRKEPSGTPVEVLLLKRIQEPDHHTEDSQLWEALVRPGRRLKPGSRISFEGFSALIVDWGGAESKGQRVVRLEADKGHDLTEALQRTGRLPLPPYITSYTGDASLYQTVYAREQNSSAAPTAGLHFTEELLRQVQVRGCKLATVCLEIGLDTFRKVDEECIEDHVIHSEAYSVSVETVRALEETREQGGRVIAVGTTAVRALESAASSVSQLSRVSDEKSTDAMGREVLPSPLRSAHQSLSQQGGETGTSYEGPASRSSLGQKSPLVRPIEHEETSLYITPGYRYQVVDALLTNFHTPRSTLLMLVAAFAGYDVMMEAYRQALIERYRFLSFGDAMLIL